MTAELLNRALGKSFRSLRTKKNLSLVEMHKRSGLTNTQDLRLERGESNPQWVTVVKALKGLKSTLRDLEKELKEHL